MSDNPKKRPGLIPDPQTGYLIGEHPDAVSESDLIVLGHSRSAPMQAMRRKCRDCCGGSVAEVRKCTACTCPLWPFRFGKRPAARRRSELGSAARAARKPR